MQLSRMDDVAGCRLIFEDLDSLFEFRQSFLKARLPHKIKNDLNKYNYIGHPKKTGYRGIHDIYSYNVNSQSDSYLKGLLVEIQYRTFIQHAWATAVEIIGFITDNQTKFERGDNNYIHAMALASEILARVYEKAKGPFPEKKGDALVQEFLLTDNKIGLLNKLRLLNTARIEVQKFQNSILMLHKSGLLEVNTYRTTNEALANLFELEQAVPDADIVLVRADTPEDIRLAFKNYFSDAQDFINLVDEGCLKLLDKNM